MKNSVVQEEKYDGVSNHDDTGRSRRLGNGDREEELEDDLQFCDRGERENEEVELRHRESTSASHNANLPMCAVSASIAKKQMEGQSRSDDDDTKSSTTTSESTNNEEDSDTINYDDSSNNDDGDAMANGSILRSERSVRFPVKLMQILASGKYDDIISWTPKGTSFVVRSPKKLVEEVFPLYFRKEQVVKYCSFTRKLHRWGFMKVVESRDTNAFCHIYFKRSDPDRCKDMRCSNRNQQLQQATHGNSWYMDLPLHNKDPKQNELQQRSMISYHQHEQRIRREMNNQQNLQDKLLRALSQQQLLQGNQFLNLNNGSSNPLLQSPSLYNHVALERSNRDTLLADYLQQQQQQMRVNHLVGYSWAERVLRHVGGGNGSLNYFPSLSQPSPSFPSLLSSHGHLFNNNVQNFSGLI